MKNFNLRPTNQNNPNVINNHPDYSYYNLIVTNADSVSTLPVNLEYKEQRSGPIINNPSHYEFSIVRFTLDTLSLPIFIPSINLTDYSTINFNEPEPTIYTITLSYTYTNPETLECTTYVSEQTPIMWIPEAIYSTTPTNTTNQQDLNSTWYYCYSYQYWVKLVNNAFVSAFESLQASLPDGITLPVSTPPFMQWNTNTVCANINAEIGSTGGFLTLFTNANTNLGDTSTNPSQYNQISIFFNSSLYNLFNSFQVSSNGFGSIIPYYFPSSIDTSGNILSKGIVSVPGGNYQLIMNGNNGLNCVLLPTSSINPSSTSLQVQSFQEYQTTPMWNPVSAVVFTSTSIPVLPSNEGNPFIYDGSLQVNGSSGANILMEITDFASTNGDYRGFLNYTANVFRFIDLMGNNPISYLNLQAYWKDRYGVSRPIQLLAGGTCTCKFLFRKKRQYLV